jgi:Transcriptional regulators
LASIRDVARRAGVSKTTVSHALSGRRAVAEKTKEKILQAIVELDYVPNRVAQNLASGKTNILGFMFPFGGSWLSGDSAAKFVLSAAQAVKSRGYDFLLSTKPGVEEVIRLARGRYTDGLVLMDVKLKDERVEYLRTLDFPFVLVGRSAANDGIDYVDIDAEKGLYLSTTRLIQLGHRRIALICLLPRNFGFSVRAKRGFEAAFRAHDLDVPHDLVLFTRPSTHEGYLAMNEIMARQPKCTACITLSDLLSYGALQFCRDHGIEVPRELSLLGFGSAMFHNVMEPPVTTIELPAAEMSRLAIEILVDRLERRTAKTRQILLTPQIIWRDSTGSAPR